MSSQKFELPSIQATNVDLALPFFHFRLQLNRVATESELYRYVRRSVRMFEQAVNRKVYSYSTTTACEPSSSTEPLTEFTGARHHLGTAAGEVLDTLMAQSSDNCGFEELQYALDR